MSTTSFTFHYRPSHRKGRCPGKLFIRVIRSRRSSHIATGYSLYADEWDASTHSIVIPQESWGNADRSDCLTVIAESMSNDLSRLHDIVSDLEASGEYSASHVTTRFSDSLDRNTVYGFSELVACRLSEQGRERTARAYRCAARSLMSFNNGMDVALSDIDTTLVHTYESSLLDRGLMLNTVSFYMRNLRALYYRAINERLVVRRSVNPFVGVHTGVYETRRRSLNCPQLQSLSRLETILNEGGSTASGEGGNRNTILWESLQYFMFCYYARGMSFVDMAYLKKQDVQKGRFFYRRRKTGGRLEIKVTEQMRKILSYFARREKTTGSESAYVFPIVDEREKNSHRLQYETGLKRQNMLLKELGEMAGIEQQLSTHVARHTWATLAKRLNISVSVISEALGHRDVKTTSIYLDSFDRSTMDKLSVRMSAAVRKSA